MKKQINIFLFDILESIKEIESYFFEKGYDFNEFVEDIKTKRAIERNLEIIGEAVNRILKIYPNIELTSSRNIVNLRNRIIHNYDNISSEIIWGIVNKNLPILKNEVLHLLNEENF